MNTGSVRILQRNKNSGNDRERDSDGGEKIGNEGKKE